MSNKRSSLSSIFQNGATALQFVQLYRFGILFLTGVVLAKMQVPSGLIGIYETLIFVSSAVSFFWLNGFMQNLLIQYPKTANPNALLQSTFWWLMGFRLLVTVLYLLFIFQVYPLLGMSQFSQPMLLFSIVVLASGASVMTEYVFLLRRQPAMLVWYSLVHYTAHIVIVALAFAVGNGIGHTVLGLIILNVARFILLAWLVFSPKIEKPQQVKLIKVMAGSAPLIAAAFFSGSVEYVSGFIVSGTIGESAFALYRYGAKELPLTLLLANAFSAALIPQIAEAGSDIKGALLPIKKATSNHIKLLFPFCGALMVASPLLYPAIFNPEFAASAVIFNIFLLLVISRFVFPQSILLGLGHRKAIVQGSAIELAVALLGGVVLGYFFGIAGVAFSVVLASFAEKGYLVYRLNRLEGVSPKQYIPLTTWVLASACVMILFAGVHFFMLR